MSSHALVDLFADTDATLLPAHTGGLTWKKIGTYDWQVVNAGGVVGAAISAKTAAYKYVIASDALTQDTYTVRASISLREGTAIGIVLRATVVDDAPTGLYYSLFLHSSGVLYLFRVTASDLTSSQVGSTLGTALGTTGTLVVQVSNGASSVDFKIWFNGEYLTTTDTNAARVTTGPSIGLVGYWNAGTLSPLAIDLSADDRYSLVNATGPYTAQPICYLLPPTYDATVGAPLVLYSHTNSGYRTEILDVYQCWRVTQALLAAGYIVAASNQGSVINRSNWGNDGSFADLVDLYSYMMARFRCTDTLLLAASMGGLGALLALPDRRLPRVKGVGLLWPVTNLDYMYDNGWSATIDTAYAADYATNAVGHDPHLLAASTWNRHMLRMYASADDTVVNKANNATAFAALATGYAREVQLVPCTGDHGSADHIDAAINGRTSGGVTYDSLTAFFARCLTHGAPPDIAVADAPGGMLTIGE